MKCRSITIFNRWVSCQEPVLELKTTVSPYRVGVGPRFKDMFSPKKDKALEFWQQIFLCFIRVTIERKTHRKRGSQFVSLECRRRCCSTKFFKLLSLSIPSLWYLVLKCRTFAPTRSFHLFNPIFNQKKSMATPSLNLHCRFLHRLYHRTWYLLSLSTTV